MKITYDPGKSEANRIKHGVSLALAARFEWDDAMQWEDTRRLYGETRMVALGRIGRRLHVVIYVDRAGGRRIISLRKANQREVTLYAKA